VSLFGEFSEGQAAIDMDGAFARQPFPTSNGSVDILGIEFNRASLAITMFASDNRRASSTKRIDDDVTGMGHVENGINDKFHGLRRGMISERLGG
jgi:hypothetical protein